MAKILSVASNEVLGTTRQLLLEQEGHSVYSVLTVPDVERIGKDEKIDLALIGHGFRGPDKRKMARAINHFYPGIAILEMCFHSPEIPGADFVLTDSPAELIKAIRQVLNGRRVRGYSE
jgi:hypothetical protein